MPSAHIAQAGRLRGSPGSITIDVYRESDPSRKLATVPSSDVARLGAGVYQVDLLGCSVSPLLELPSAAQPEGRVYTLVWSDDAGNQIVTTERVRIDASASFRLFVVGKGLKSQAQLAKVRRRLTEQLGREPLIAVIDVLDDPGAALAARVVATPALVQVSPGAGGQVKPA